MKSGLLDENDIRIKDLLSQIFTTSYSRFVSRSAADVSYFHLYFYNTLLSSDISEAEFAKLRGSSFDQMKQFVDGFIDTKGRALVHQLQRYKQTNDEEAKHILRMIFYATAKHDNFSFPPDVIYEILMGMSTDMDQKKALLEQLLLENGASNYVKFIVYSLESPYSRHSWRNLISDAQQKEYLLKMLQFAVDEGRTIGEIFDFYRYTQKLKAGRKGDADQDFEDMPEATEIMKPAFMSRLEEFLPDSIYRNHLSSSKNSFQVANYVKRIWGSWEAFENYLNTLEETPLIREYKDFYSHWKNNQRTWVEFEFREMKKNFD